MPRRQSAALLAVRGGRLRCFPARQAADSASTADSRIVVFDAAVELATGRLTVTADATLDPALIEVAVDEAGYRLAAS